LEIKTAWVSWSILTLVLPLRSFRGAGKCHFELQLLFPQFEKRLPFSSSLEGPTRYVRRDSWRNGQAGESPLGSQTSRGRVGQRRFPGPSLGYGQGQAPQRAMCSLLDLSLAFCLWRVFPTLNGRPAEKMGTASIPNPEPDGISNIVSRSYFVLGRWGFALHSGCSSPPGDHQVLRSSELFQSMSQQRGYYTRCPKPPPRERPQFASLLQISILWHRKVFRLS
jgi:hypothetical protein